jgi:hypothetical protein
LGWLWMESKTDSPWKDPGIAHGDHSAGIHTKQHISLTSYSLSFLQMCHNSVVGTSFNPASIVKKVGTKLFACENCGRSYMHRRNLWRHTKHECGKEPQLQCLYCPKKSKLKANLKQHMIKHESQFYKQKQRSEQYIS